MAASRGTGGEPPAPVGGDLFPVIVPRSRREREGAKRHVPGTRLRRVIATLAAVTGGVLAWAAVPAAAVEGSGAITLLADRLGYVLLAEPVRFTAAWEREASLRLRSG